MDHGESPSGTTYNKQKISELVVLQLVDEILEVDDKHADADHSIDRQVENGEFFLAVERVVV